MPIPGLANLLSHGLKFAQQFMQQQPHHKHKRSSISAGKHGII